MLPSVSRATRIDEILVLPRGAQHRGAQIRHARAAEAPDPQRREAREQRRDPRRLVVAVARDHEQRQRADVLADLGEQREALGVGPLEIFEQHEHRIAQSLHHLAEHAEQAGSRDLHREPRQGRHLAAEQRAQVRQQRAEHARLQRREIHVQREQLEHAAPDVVGGPPARVRLPAHRQHAGAQRPDAQLVEQARLAHAALAADEEHRSPSRARLVERVAEPPQLLVAPREARRHEVAVPRRRDLTRDRRARRGGDLFHQRRRVGLAARGRLAERPADGRAQRRRQRREVRLRAEHPGDHLRRLAAGLEGPAPAQHLVRDDADGVEIGRFTRTLSAKQLGGHVRQRPRRLLVARLFPDRGQPEVEHLERGAGLDPRPRAGAGDEEIVRLEVPVHDAAPVQVTQRGEELHEQIHLRCAGRRGREGQQRLGVREQLHGEIRAARGVEPVVEHADDVGVPQRGQDPELLRQRLQIGPRGGRAERDALQRHGPSREPVHAAIDPPHAALPDEIDHLVATIGLRLHRRADLHRRRRRSGVGRADHHQIAHEGPALGAGVHVRVDARHRLRPERSIEQREQEGIVETGHVGGSVHVMGERRGDPSRTLRNGSTTS
ncbi:MAG: hypothetical protein QM820_06830 [Minicystis sp.]